MRRWGEPAASYAENRSFGGMSQGAARPPVAEKPSAEPREDYKPVLKKKTLLSDQSVFEAARKEEPAPALFEEKPEGPAQEPVIPLGQVADCFIVCQHGKDLYLIDQHAAHERVRYDRLAERAEGIPVQELLIPYLIHTEPADAELLLSREAELRRLGITIEQAGPDVIRVTGAPEDLSESDMERVIRDILIAFHEKDVPSPETMRHRMMAYAACRGAIKAGDPLNIRQMRELIHDLFQTARPFVCPHGRPTIVRFTPEEMGRLFHRT